MATGGITHLVEHLALSGLGELPHPYEGMVDSARTIFYAEGSEEEVVSFLNRVSVALHQLPLDRIAMERRVLRTEAASAELGMEGVMLARRYGAAGHGLLAYPEYGLNWLEETQVQGWANDRFTSDSAALWVTGPPPKGLDLSLPCGERPTPPSQEPIVSKLPAFLHEGDDGVGVSFVGTRSPGLSLAHSLVVRLARRHLRQELGISYEVDGGVTLLNSMKVHCGLAADCLPEHVSAVRDQLLEVLRKIADSGPSQEDLQYEITQGLRELSDPTRHTGWMDLAVEDLLYGLEPRDPKHLAEEIRGVKGESVAQAIVAALPSVLLLLPEMADPPSEGFAPYEPVSMEPVNGQLYRPRSLGAFGLRLELSNDGITVRAGKNDATVRFAQCAAVGLWRNGDRVLIGENGMEIRLRPRQWAHSEDLTRLIDSRVPADRFMPMDDVELSSFRDRLIGRRRRESSFQ
jgi:zinc protease